ncbi:ras guanine nucleotide exchange factor domain-containing protein [Chytridium lagenaria]|nr:ras guanine nucleotide exchange factor domain-containing protein [Chytridium lagenaria]
MAAPSEEFIDTVIAVHNYEAKDSTCISFQKGDVIDVIAKDQSGWWDGCIRGVRGWFPSNYVESRPFSSTPSPESLKDGTAQLSIPPRELATRGRSGSLSAASNDEFNALEQANSNSVKQQLRGKCIILTCKQIKRHTNIEEVTKTEKSVKRSTLLFMETAKLDPALSALKETDRAADSSIDSHRAKLMSPRYTSKVRPKPAYKRKTDLTNILDRQDRKELLSGVDAVLGSIRLMFYASGTVSKNSRELLSHVTLRSHHHNILSLLSQLVITARSACSLWPPPDAIQQVQQISGKILLPVRYFAATAQDVDIQLKDVEHLKNLAQLPNSAQTAHEGDLDLELDLRGPGMTDTELVSRIEADADRVIVSDARLVSMITRNRVFSEALIDQARETVTLAGEFMSVIEEIKIAPRSPDQEMDAQTLKATYDFNTAKESMYTAVNDLITAARSTMDEFAPPNAMAILLDRASVILSSVDELVLTSKLIIDQEDLRSQRNIQKEAARFEDGSKRDSELVLLQRRAMSLTLATTSAEEKPRGQPRATSQLSRDVPHLDNYAPDMTIPGPPRRHDPNNLGSRVNSNPVLRRRPSGVGLMDELGRGVNRPANAYDAPRAMGNISRAASVEGFSSRNGAPSPSPPPLPNSKQDEFEGRDSTTSQKTKLNKFFGEDVPERRVVNVEGSANSNSLQMRPWYLMPDSAAGTISFNGEGSVNGGTLEALVQRLTLHDQTVDAVFASTFLMMFRCFTNSVELMNHFIHRYNMPPPENLRQEDYKTWVEKKQTPIRLRVFNALKLWLDNYWIEVEDYPALTLIMDLANGPMASAQPGIAKRLEGLALIKLNAPPGNATYTPATLPPNMSVDPPPAIIPRVPVSRLTLEDIDPLEIVRQLTIAQSRIFNVIHPTELIDKTWSKNVAKAPNVRMLTEVSNRITNWAVASILADGDVRKRAATLKHFIKTADCCLLLNNYELLMAFFIRHQLLRHFSITANVGCKYSTDFNLRVVCALSNKSTSVLETLRRLMDSNRNHSEYRQRLRNGSPPFLPFLGLYLTDLTFVADGNPNMRTQKLINFDKHVKAYRIITDLQRFQMPYALFEVPEIMHWILAKVKSPNQPTAQSLYELSLRLEPRENEEAAARRELDEKMQELQRAGLL